ncbi:MetQ/NlpA family ABC transporter substrate-binding protein [Streptomyces sp. NPDC059708]|uniref:MetQ/NlpA family ABC transporter substrate-binding protein n=1 Tax=Streptomyces sp. NPDC059708 TaxID=3346916 RepID=UPI00368294D1
MSAATPRRRTALAFTTTATALALLLSGCGLGGSDGKRIRVGVSGDSPEWDVLAKEAKKEGLNVETVVFDDYSLPNKALGAGDIDLNAFQHLVFLAQSNTANKTDITPVAATTVVPLGLYSSKHKQLADLPDGASVTLPNDPSNQGRALHVLEQAKLIELKKDAGLFATPDDITANPKHVKITPVNAQQTPRTLQDADAAVINDGVAQLAGIDAKSALYKDDPASPQALPYLNVIAARADRKDDADFQKIVKLYASQAVQDEVRRTSNGTAHHIELPASELRDELGRITKQLAAR